MTAIRMCQGRREIESHLGRHLTALSADTAKAGHPRARSVSGAPAGTTQGRLRAATVQGDRSSARSRVPAAATSHQRGDDSIRQVGAQRFRQRTPAHRPLRAAMRA